MLRFIVRRCLVLIPLFIGVTILSFYIANLSPGDPVAMYLDPYEQPDPQKVEAIRRQLGLDKPVITRYFLWLAKVLKGDLGYSLASKRPVLDEILARVGPSLLLSGTALCISFILGISLGVYSALNQYKTGDYVLTVLSFIGISMPTFWFAMLLIILFTGNSDGCFVVWSVSHSARDRGTTSWTWPHTRDAVTVTTLGSIAGWALIERFTMLEVLRQDFVRTARAKGIRERLVIFRHAVRNAALPIITQLGMALPGLIGGSFVIESIFGWPGMGRLGTQAIFGRDYPVIMGVNIMSSLLIMLGNLAADVTYALVDPRIRYAGGGEK